MCYKEIGYIGNHLQGEIEIITDQEEMKKVAKLRHQRVKALGLGDEATKLGTVFEDEYVVICRDPVKFPNGTLGTYLRIIERPALNGVAGVVILPVQDGSIYLRRIFRHSTRSWELECPRGFRPKGFAEEEAVQQELSEELGLEIKNLVDLGAINSNSGLLAGHAQIFWVNLLPGDPEPKPEDEEAFGETLKLTPSQLVERISAGEIRDAFTLSALQRAQAKGLLNLNPK